MSYFPKPSLNENDLAIIERGDTAAHSIEAGQYVSWKGRTGKAKAAILQGATLDETLFDYDEDGILNSSLTELTGTITALNTDLTFDYPTGFTFQNARIICFEVLVSGIWRNTSMMLSASNIVANASTRSDKIYVFASGSSTLNASFRLVLQKV